ncbi:MAG TPA: Vps62-related protein [Nocardioides sp.]|uniref:Vps62-related protein n=1 Tax=Nocardioides sp. TaxID=35761 RepID=UPI002E37C4B6|nr:Vps62-related protein [Nocardioides sp.]HEX3931672.1 Vps62-related protein [Nocardioides sp.]
MSAALGMVTTAVTVVAALGPTAPAYADSSPAAHELAQRYSPIVMLREFTKPCGPGEPFVPMRVNAVLDNPEVALRQVGNHDAVIQWAPTAKALYGRGTGTYLDLPGDALSPGCIYARDSARYTPLSQAAVYAHVTTQADKPGYVAVQYWLYWYYNDWNDLHESDWEFVQVLIKAPSVEAALTTQPFQLGYAQHTGGETADWDSDKLQKDGDHPVVYSSEGSHASYFEPALYLGRSADEGFGCDNTQTPNTRVVPKEILLPDRPSGPDSRFAWLAFHGRWGERHAGPNNGPDGPMGKPRWRSPVTWQENLRPSSFVIPGGSSTPPSLVGTFCNVVGKGSVLYVRYAAQPGAVLGILAALALGVAFLLRRTRWDKVPPYPVVTRRRSGEIVRAAVDLYRRHIPAFVVAGMLAVPVGVLAMIDLLVLQHLPYVGTIVRVSTQQAPAGNNLLFSSWVATSFWPLTVLLVSAAVAHAMDDGASRTTLGRGWLAVRAVGARWRPLAVSYLPAAVAIGLLSWTGIGVPVAAWLTVRYQYLGQIVMREDLAGTAARKRAGDLVRHRWLHTAAVVALVWAGIHGLGILLGLILLIFFTSLPLWSLTLIVLVVEVALTPLGTLALTLLYGDAAAQHDQAEELPEPAGVAR